MVLSLPQPRLAFDFQNDQESQWLGVAYVTNPRHIVFVMCWITLPATLLCAATIMSLEAARSLYISDLIKVLNERLDGEWARLLDSSLSPTVPVTSVISEVCTPWPIHPLS